jgi:hypothetical protein
MKFNEWLMSMRSNNRYDRLFVVENIPDDVDEEILVPILLELLHDSDSLIRTCVAELLENYPRNDVINGLKSMIEIENDNLAKSYAIASLGYIAKIEDIPFLMKILNDKNDMYIHMHANFAIFLCIHNYTIENLTNSLISIFNSDSDMKETIVNIIKHLYELVDSKKSIIVQSLTNYSALKNNTISVSDTIQLALKELQKSE